MWYRILVTTERGKTDTFDREGDTPLDALETLDGIIVLPTDTISVTPIPQQNVCYDF